MKETSSGKAWSIVLVIGAAVHAASLIGGEVALGKEPTEPVVTTRLFMPQQILIRGKVGPLEGYFGLDTGSPFNVPTPIILEEIRGNVVEGKRGIPAEIAIEGKPFATTFNREAAGLGARIARQFAQQHPGIPFLGILGHSFLSRYVVRIDYPGQTLSLYAPAAIPLPPESELGPEHLLVGYTHTPQRHILLDVAMEGEKPLAGKLLFDTGAPRFEFPPQLGARHGFPQGRIPAMRIGTMAWRDVPTHYVRPMGEEGMIGILSNEQLYNTVVTLYYGEMKLSIRRDPFRAPGPAPGELGLRMTPDGKVVSVTEGSRASACGLSAEDVVTAVDGLPVANVMEIQAACRFHDGKSPLTFEVRRGTGRIDLKEAPAGTR